LLVVASFVAVVAVLWVLLLRVGPALERRIASCAPGRALAVIVAMASAITLVFIALAFGVQQQSSWLRDLDSSIDARAPALRSETATKFFLLWTKLGTNDSLVIVVTIASAFLLLRRRWSETLYLVVSANVGAHLARDMKAFFGRARPDAASGIVGAGGSAFPSGHAVAITVVFAALAYLAFRTIPSWRGRGAAIAFAASIILAVSASRIYLGVHWMSDVLAGIAVGLLWVLTATVAYEWLRYKLTRSSSRTSRGA
jgi:undecaprenyl-diphosphatase